MKISCQLLTDEELEEQVLRAYPSAGSNKLRRIEFADFLRADSFPELIHITFAGFPFHNTVHADFLCKENHITSLNSILNLTNLRI
jgi:hypothetical protein